MNNIVFLLIRFQNIQAPAVNVKYTL